MACDRPDGNCTDVSGCPGGCGCVEPAAPVMPRCQNVTLPAGTYAYATVVVNSDGCIAMVTAGDPPVYTPDDCCAGGGTGGGGTGGRGPKGDPGPAATIAVDPVVLSGATWSVQNIGTPSAAVFQFTAPPMPTSGGSTGSGYTGNVAGLSVANGLVQTLPTSLVTSVTATALGAHAGDFLFLSVPTPATGAYNVQLNLDGFYAAIMTEVAAANAVQDAAIDALENQVALLQTQVADLQTQVTTLQATIDTMQLDGENNIVWNNGAADAIVTWGWIAGGSTTTYTIPAGGYVTFPTVAIGVPSPPLAVIRQGATIVHIYGVAEDNGGSGGV